jgi:hypothetical protein
MPGRRRRGDKYQRGGVPHYSKPTKSAYYEMAAVCFYQRELSIEEQAEYDELKWRLQDATEAYRPVVEELGWPAARESLAYACRQRIYNKMHRLCNPTTFAELIRDKHRLGFLSTEG